MVVSFSGTSKAERAGFEVCVDREISTDATGTAFVIGHDEDSPYNPHFGIAYQAFQDARANACTNVEKKLEAIPCPPGCVGGITGGACNLGEAKETGKASGSLSSSEDDALFFCTLVAIDHSEGSLPYDEARAECKKQIEQTPGNTAKWAQSTVEAHATGRQFCVRYNGASSDSSPIDF